MKRALVIRFSSFGDIIQSFEAVEYLKNQKYCVTFFTKSQFAELVASNSSIDTVFQFDKKLGLLGLIKMAIKLAHEDYDLLFDAHNNLRSRFIKIVFRMFSRKTNILVRSKHRFKRFLYFKLGIKSFSFPIKGRETYISPFGVSVISKNIELNFSDSAKDKLPDGEFIAIAPSAAWPMKRWPIAHFKELISKIDPSYKIVLLGGPDDQFIKELELNERVINLAGKLSLLDSSYVVSQSKIVITGDTGLLHVADVIGKDVIALMGPTAFGYPSSSKAIVLDKKLSCAPCSKDGRGKCSQVVYQKCLVDISAEDVLNSLNFRLSSI